MSTPSPFEIGRAVGGNVSNGIRGAREQNSIDQILAQANSTGNQEDIDNAMQQILTRVSPEKQQMAMQVLQQKQARLTQQRQAQAYQAQGLDPNLPEGINKEIVKKRGEGNDKQMASRNALNLVNRARELAQTGHLGPKVGILGTGRSWGSTVNPFGDSAVQGRKIRAEYKQIGKALVQAAAPLKITNRAEFQHYAEDLENPNRNLEEIQGSLDAMERIIRNSLGENTDRQQFADQKAQSTMETPKQAERPALTSFYR